MADWSTKTTLDVTINYQNLMNVVLCFIDNIYKPQIKKYMLVQ